MMFIFNIQHQDISRHTLAVGLTGDGAREVATAYQGCRVALGVSHVRGAWAVIGSATLAGYWFSDHAANLIVTDIDVLPEPHRIVTLDQGSDDSLDEPYGMDVLDQADAQDIFGSSGDYENGETPRLWAAEGAISDSFDIFPEVRQPGQLVNSLVDRLAQAYRNRCAFTGMAQFSRDGRLREGIAVAIDGGRIGSFDTPPSQGLFASRTFAFCYRHGQLAIGEDYDILRHRDLSAEARMLLEMVNRKAMLLLPEDESVWPDLDAARRHRRRFGF